MTNQKLLDFIKSQLQLGVNREIITKQLLANEWTTQDVEEGFNVINVPTPNISNQDLSSIDTSNLVNQNQQQIKYAGFWIRYLALLIDGLILLIPTTVIFYFVIKSVGIPEDITIDSIRPLINIAIVLNLLISWTYSIFMIYKYQATLGKKAMGIKVFSENSEQPLTFGKIILREALGKFISGFILQIGYIMVAFTDKKQGLHDKIAKTIVVYKDPNKKTSKWIIFIIIFVFIGIPFLGGLISSIMLGRLSNAVNSINDKSKIMEQNSLPNPYINEEKTFSFSYPESLILVKENSSTSDADRFNFYFSLTDEYKFTNMKMPMGNITETDQPYKDFISKFKETETLNNVLEETLENNGIIWNVATVKDADGLPAIKIIMTQKDSLNYRLSLMYTPLEKQKEIVDETGRIFMSTFKFIDSKVNQEENIKVIPLEECLPENIKLDDVVDARIIGGKIGDNTLKIEKTAVSQKLNELKAVCSSDNKLIDQNKKEIVFYQLKGCWGILPPNGEEIMLNQDNELKDLKEKFNVIEMTCNPSGIPIP